MDYLFAQNAEPTRARGRFAGMIAPETVFHNMLFVIGALGILVSLAGIAFWCVSRRMGRLT